MCCICGGGSENIDPTPTPDPAPTPDPNPSPDPTPYPDEDIDNNDDKEGYKTLFNQFDVNNNNNLSDDEFARFYNEHCNNCDLTVKELKEKYDSNDDRVVSLDEFD